MALGWLRKLIWPREKRGPAEIIPFQVREDDLTKLMTRINEWELWDCPGCSTTHVGVPGDCPHAQKEINE